MLAMEILPKLDDDSVSMNTICEKDQFEKGDILLHANNGTMYRVQQLDTKNRSPRQGYKTFYRLDTEKVEIKAENPQ